MKYRSIYLGLGILVAIGWWLHFQAARLQPWFGDEISSLWFANDHTWTELLTTPAEADHQNTFYLLVKVVFSISHSTAGLRWLMLGIFTLTTYFIYILTRYLVHPPWQRAVILIFWLWSAYILRFTYLVRMYSLGLFFGVVSLLCITRWIQSRKPYYRLISLASDIAGIMVVFGYWYWLGLKYVTLIYWHYWEKRRFPTKLLPEIGLWLAVILITILGERQNIHSFNQQFAWWMPPLKGLSAFSMFSTLLGITSPGFFEGYTADAPTPIIGIIITSGIVINLILNLKHQKNAHHRWLSSLLIGAGLIYGGVFLLDYLTDIPSFHVRQLFGVAMVLTLVIPAYILNQNTRLLSMLSITLFIVFILMSRRSWSYGQPNFQAYPPRYVNPPSDLRWISAADIELGFDQCHAYSLEEMNTKCSELGYSLASAENLTRALSQPESFAITTTVYEKHKPLLSPICQSISVDFYHCQPTTISAINDN